MQRKSELYAIILAMCMIMLSCKEDTEPYPTKYWAVDLVTFIRNDDRNGISVELQRTDKAEKYRMNAPQYIDTIIPRGRRVLVSYEAELADTSKRPMPILLTGMSLIPFDTIRPMPIEEIGRLHKPQINVLSCWKSGKFVNFQVELQSDGNERSFSIVADASTISSSRLDCYLYNTGEPVGENYIDSRDYGSFFAGEVINGFSTEIIRIFTNGVDDKKSFIDIVIDSH